MSKQAYVKLKDPGHTFHDPSQRDQEAVTGNKIVRINLSEKAQNAIRANILTEVKDPPADVVERYENPAPKAGIQEQGAKASAASNQAHVDAVLLKKADPLANTADTKAVNTGKGKNK